MNPSGNLIITARSALVACSSVKLTVSLEDVRGSEEVNVMGGCMSVARGVARLSDVELSGCTATSRSMQANGGGLGVRNSTLEMTNGGVTNFSLCTWSENFAGNYPRSGHGGAIFLSGGQHDFSECVFCRRTAAERSCACSARTSEHS